MVIVIKFIKLKYLKVRPNGIEKNYKYLKLDNSYSTNVKI